jgi:hypothetical protein
MQELETRNHTISHNIEEETPGAKARWFQSLSLSERMEMLCLFTDMILSHNPNIGDQRYVKPTTESIRIVSTV